MNPLLTIDPGASSGHTGSFSTISEETAVAIVLRVARGYTSTLAGRDFDPDEMAWARGEIAAGRARRMKGLPEGEAEAAKLR